MIKFYKNMLMRLMFVPLSGLFGGNDSGSSGAAMQGQYNQQAIDEIKRQFELTQDNIAPYLGAGATALTDVQQGSTAQGLDARLAEIFNSDTFGSLIGERQRAVQGQLSAGGLTRSGTATQEMANVPTDLGMMLEQLLTNRSTGIANTGANSAIGLGNIGANASGNIANIYSNTGQAAANGAVTDAQSEAQGNQNLLNTAATVGMMFFSDPSLKENIEKIGMVNDLTLYQWDWKESTKGTMIDGCWNAGFMADEVKVLYPQHIGEFGGFMVINYPSLLKELEEA